MDNISIEEVCMSTDILDHAVADQVKITVLIDDNSGFERNILAQHGISLLIDIDSGGINKRILFDTGQSAMPILHNMKQLKINPESIDMIVLSHCHWDHTSGLVDILKEMPRIIPIIAHPSIFRAAYKTEPFLMYTGVSNENKLDKIINTNGQLVLIDEPICLMKGVITTGEVERTTDFEFQVTENYTILDCKKCPDIFVDELALAINIYNKGLLIITGCSHAGIVNIIEHTKKITGIGKVYGIVGGLHLIKASDERINNTLSRLLALDIELIALGHCTGIKAMSKFSDAFVNKCINLHSGKVISVS